MSRILDPKFKYVPAHATDLKARFRKVRAELKAKAEQAARNEAEAEAKVKPLQKRSKA